MNIKGKNIELREFTLNNLNDQNYFKWLRDKDVINTIGRSMRKKIDSKNCDY